MRWRSRADVHMLGVCSLWRVLGLGANAYTVVRYSGGTVGVPSRIRMDDNTHHPNYARHDVRTVLTSR